MPFGNSGSRLSRRDSVKIAQRFNAGSRGWIPASPGGTTETRRRPPVFCRPSGTRFRRCRNPALKRWAIVGCPSGTTALNSRKALGLTRRRGARRDSQRESGERISRTTVRALNSRTDFSVFIVSLWSSVAGFLTTETRWAQRFLGRPPTTRDITLFSALLCVLCASALKIFLAASGRRGVAMALLNFIAFRVFR